jgi:hypothetical protein
MGSPAFTDDQRLTDIASDHCLGALLSFSPEYCFVLEEQSRYDAIIELNEMSKHDYDQNNA